MATGVSNSWLVNVNVAINTVVVQTPAFNYCALVGVMPSQVSPYQSPPSSWSGANYMVYTDVASFNADFTPLIVAAESADDYLQINRFLWLMDSVSAFFAQSPTPQQLYVFATPLPSSATNYATVFNNLTTANNNWYGFSLCDLILANSYSYCVAILTCNAGFTLPAGTALTPKTASAYYTNLQPYTFGASGTYYVPFYSTDATTVVASSTFTGISPSIAAVTTVSNPNAAVNGLPGYNTTTTGVVAGLSALRSATNQKKMFQDFNDYTQPGLIQTAGGSKDLTCFYHSLNLQTSSTSTRAQLGEAALSEYFINVFQGNNGLTQLSSMQLTGQPRDPVIATANIGIPGQAGSSTNLIGWNNNVYASFGAPPGIGLIQYGYQSNSLPDAQIYLDQVVGADYVQFVSQANLVTLILNSLPSGIPYSDEGIQIILNNFKNSLQQAVNQNILQPFTNSNFTYTNYAQVTSMDISNRIYQDLSFSGLFLSRIQRIAVAVNLSI